MLLFSSILVTLSLLSVECSMPSNSRLRGRQIYLQTRSGERKGSNRQVALTSRRLLPQSRMARQGRRQVRMEVNTNSRMRNIMMTAQSNMRRARNNRQIKESLGSRMVIPVPKPQGRKLVGKGVAQKFLMNELINHQDIYSSPESGLVKDDQNDDNESFSFTLGFDEYDDELIKEPKVEEEEGELPLLQTPIIQEIDAILSAEGNAEAPSPAPIASPITTLESVRTVVPTNGPLLETPVATIASAVTPLPIPNPTPVQAK